MSYTKPVTQLIKQRTSWRSYQERPLDQDIQKQVQEFLAEQQVGPFGTSARFVLITASAEDNEALKGLGTYGFIHGARAFIVGAVKPAANNLEDYGYLMERIILFATDLGLGTCWLGGTFNKSNFAKKIAITDNEIVPAVSPLGYGTEKRGLMDRVVRWGAGSKNRLSWESLFFQDTFSTPLSHETAADYAMPLEMVRLAPSASNKQPWRIVKEKETAIFHFYLQRTKGYQKTSERFKMTDLQRVDLGIAMCHFQLATQEKNLPGTWKILPPTRTPQPEDAQYIVSWLGE